MKKQLYGVFVGVLLDFCSQTVFSMPYRYSLCNEEGITCIQVQPGDTWYDLWPDERERDVVRRLNRINTHLSPGMVLAVPDNLSNVDQMDISPFSYHIAPPGRRLVLVDPKRLAWGAYSSDGNLVNWGPISGGRGYCPDIRRSGRTPSGSFSVYSKRGADCFSTKFPIGEGGAPMPYCMFFKGGYAMHGGYVPGFNASHGCIRLFTEDARWLNEEFVSTGTKVVVYGY